ncbi:MAG: hypothetical protein ACE366_31820 [Bradymonadia bacterium]
MTLWGCEPPPSTPPERTIFVQVDPEADGGLPPVDGADAGFVPDPDYPHILVIAGEPERSVNIESRIELGVLLLDNQGEPVPEAFIYFDIDDPDQATQTRITARRVTTDETGYGKIELLAGPLIEDVEIVARGEASREVRFTVHVLELPTGGLEVVPDYAGPINLGSMEVYLVESPAWCDSPVYLFPPEDILLSATTQGPMQPAIFDSVLSGTRLAVVVRARTEEGRILAGGGCVNDVEVPPLDMRTVRVPIFLLPLESAGTYTVQNRFDFTNAVPGTLGRVIDGLVQFFGAGEQEREIASVIFDVVEQLAREAAGTLGGIAVELVRAWVEDDLNRIINTYIDYDAPQWIRDFFQIGRDLLQVVADLEVISRVRLSKVRTDGTFEGSESWIGLAFRWTLPCGENNPDPDCGRHEFTMEQVASGLEGVDLVFGQFNGRVHSYDRMIINSHTLDLQYGRLILFVLNNLILPEVADGADNITDALLNLADCPAFANRMTNGRDTLELGGIEIASRDSIEGWCTTVMSVAGDGARAILGRLRTDTRITLSGDVLLIEQNNDLRVDALVDGVWRGNIRTGADDGPPFEGRFEGLRDTRLP